MPQSHLVERTTPGLHDALMKRLTSIPRDVSVLDVGCGSGAWLERLAAAGFSKLAGVDRDVSGFCGKSAAFYHGDLEQGCLGEVQTATFDIVTLIEVIEHVENTGLLLDALAGVLAPRGELWLTTPNIESVLARLRFFVTGRLRHFDCHGDPTHVHPFHLPLLTKMCDRRGLVSEAVWTYPENRGGIGTRLGARLALRLAGVLLRDEYPGDILCLHLRKLR